MPDQIFSPATMDHHQPARLSKTLPKDFTFFNPDAEPRTPERPTEEVNVPPAPNHASCPFRRQRLDVLSTFEAKPMTFSPPDVPLPSIEVPDETAVTSPTLSSHDPAAASEFDNHLQVPARERLEFRTPPAQIRDAVTCQDMSSFPVANEAADNAASISRPSSACSNISNSSVSSCESYLSRPSFGGSCTSPESEIQDPFVAHPPPSSKNKEKEEEDFVTPPPMPEATPICGASFDAHAHNEPRWTADMDNHLWNTYQTYLQNPTATPFKTVPGSLPPLGVSHRVAREARKTWPRARRASPLAMKAGKPRRTPLRRDVTPANKQQSSSVAATGERSGSTTPTAGSPSSKKKKRKKQRTWPRSNASTRRRLKELCKRKFSIAPHYQRLLQSRSPSPFAEASASSQPGPLRRMLSFSSGHAASFTRDLGVSLVASSLPTTVCGSSAEANAFDISRGEQTNNGNETAQSILPSIEFSQSDDPQESNVNPISNNNAFLGQQPSNNNMRRLGSPFMYRTWGPDKLHRRRNPSAPTNRHPGTMHVTGVRLRSPIPEDMFPGAHKRRALNHTQDDDDDGDPPYGPDGFGHDLPDLLSDGNKNAVNRRIRLRNRGATTGAISSRERLLQLFTPPSASQMISSSGDTNNNDNLGLPSSSHHHHNPDEPTQATNAKRLGSPFCLAGSGGLHVSSHSEPFAAVNSQCEQQLGEHKSVSAPQHETDRIMPYVAGMDDGPSVTGQNTESIERSASFH